MQVTRLFIITILGFLGLASAVLYSACIKDNCDTVICNNDGICVSGICSCPAGYEGRQCETTWNAKFTGTWHADEVALRDTTISGHKYFDIQVTGNATKDSLYVANFAAQLNTILCTRTAYRQFSFQPDQRLSDTTITIKSGNGFLDSTTGNIRGAYTYMKKLATKDTFITINFTWKK